MQAGAVHIVGSRIGVDVIRGIKSRSDLCSEVVEKSSVKCLVVEPVSSFVFTHADKSCDIDVCGIAAEARGDPCVVFGLCVFDLSLKSKDVCVVGIGFVNALVGNIRVDRGLRCGSGRLRCLKSCVGVLCGGYEILKVDASFGDSVALYRGVTHNGSCGIKSSPRSFDSCLRVGILVLALGKSGYEDRASDGVVLRISLIGKVRNAVSLSLRSLNGIIDSVGVQGSEELDLRGVVYIIQLLASRCRIVSHVEVVVEVLFEFLQFNEYEIGRLVVCIVVRVDKSLSDILDRLLKSADGSRNKRFESRDPCSESLDCGESCLGAVNVGVCGGKLCLKIGELRFESCLLIGKTDSKHVFQLGLDVIDLSLELGLRCESVLEIRLRGLDIALRRHSGNGTADGCSDLLFGHVLRIRGSFR